MGNDLYFWFVCNYTKFTYYHDHHKEWVNWKRIAQYKYKIIEKIDLILDTHWTVYTWQALYIFITLR